MKKKANRIKKSFWLFGAFIVLGAVLALSTNALHGPWALYKKEAQSWLVLQSWRAGFSLEDLEIKGAVYTQKNDILQQLDLDMGAPLLALDLDDMQRNLENLPWVKKAAVKRVLPRGLEVQIEEFGPFAFWQQEGKIYLIDRTGRIIKAESLSAFEGLRSYVGPNANREAAALADIIAAYPELEAALDYAIRVGDRRWDLVFKGGVRVKLPEDQSLEGGGNLKDHIARFARLEAQYHLLARDVAVIDLRLEDRLIMRVNPDLRSLVTPHYKKT